MAEIARNNKYFMKFLIISGIVLFFIAFIYLGIIKNEKDGAEYININLELSKIHLLMTIQEIEELNIGKLVDSPNTGGKIKEITEKKIRLGFGELGKYKDKLTYLEIGNKEYSVFNGKLGDTKIDIINSTFAARKIVQTLEISRLND